MKQPRNEFNRRDFLRGSSLAAVMAMMGGIELSAQTPATTNAEPALTAIPVGPTVKYGIIGLGPWSRDIIIELGKLPNAPVVAICDTYKTALRRAGEASPKAEKYDDYKKLLENKDVQAVVIATPTHQHKDIVIDALKAGKHVYCEAPLAGSIEDAKAIAQAAKASIKSVFQSGIQLRAYPPIIMPKQGLLSYVRAGAAGNLVMTRAQWHKKQSWVFPSPNPEREKEINWRLRKETSTGLMGEIGIHQIDLMTWFLKSRPTAVSGFGSIMAYRDGRDVPDTAQTVFEYPSGANFMYDVSIATSFDSAYEVFHGLDGTIMRRGSKAWMFKEPDSALLGWEVYARTETFFGEKGISLAAGATKQVNSVAIAKNANIEPFPNSPLYYALETFTANVGLIGPAVEDFVSNFGDSDPQALQDQLATLKPQPAPGWKEGLEATVLAIKANEAVMKKERIALQNEWFEI